MNFFKQRIPYFLLTKRNQIQMVIFVSLFALAFINIFKPFRSDRWFQITGMKYFLLSAALVFQGFVIVLVSRLIMYYYTRKHPINNLGYGLWIIGELFVMAASFTIWSLKLGLQTEFTAALGSAAENTALLLFIPCTIAIVYLSLKEKEHQLRKMVTAKEAVVAGSNKSLISFYDDRGSLLLSIAKENFLFIESADNYVCLWYLKNDAPKKKMLRITMKKVMEQLVDTNVMRCHRSYMVNLEKIKMIRRDKDSLYLELGIPSVMDIPVSKTYGETVIKWLLEH